MPKISALPAMTTVDTADELPINDVSVTTSKKLTLTKLKEWLQAAFVLIFPTADGWITANETWSYSNWNNTTKTGTITIPAGGVSKYSVNDWVKFTQSTGGVKYGKILTVADTVLTVNMLTYTLNNEAITANYYSHAENPVGAMNLKAIKFLAYPSAGQSSLSSGAATTVAFNTENYDTGGFYNNSTYKFTAPVSGYYNFNSHVRVDGNMTTLTSALSNAQIQKAYDSISAGSKSTICNSDTYLNAGTDVYCVVTGFTSSGTWQITADSSHFSGHLISVV